MFSSILSAICALALNANLSATAADTSSVYIIDGEKVENFDGSQLVGKTIVRYSTGTAGKSVKLHLIYTTDSDKKLDFNVITIPGDGLTILREADAPSVTVSRIADSVHVFNSQSIIYVLDGKKASVQEFMKLKADKIKSIEIYKDKEQFKEQFKKYGADSANAVIVIDTKR